jgi:tetratricopeptide (TPR) repeat protein
MIIVENPWIKDFRRISDFFTTNIWAYAGEGPTNFYRPIPLIIYMVDYYIFGLAPWGFHLSYVLLHSVVSVTVLLFMKRVFSLGFPDSPPWLPLLGALLFATHPIHTEVVAWNNGQEMVFTLFTLSCIFFHSRGKPVAAVTFFILAAFTKETAVVIPVLLFAHDYCFDGDRLFAGGKKALVPLAARYAPYVAAGVIYMFIRSNAIGGFAPTNNHPELTVPLFALNILVLFSEYMVKLLLPINLNAAYTFDGVWTFFEARALFAYATAAAYLSALLIFRNRNRLAFFSLILIAVPLLPVFYIPAFGSHVFAERYLYIPSIGFIALLLPAFATLVGRAALATEKKTALIAVPILILSLIFSVATVKRNTVWKSNLTLWEDTVKKSPTDVIARYNMGSIYYKLGRIDEAIGEYEAAVELKPDAMDPHFNLALAYHAKGVFDEAAREYQTALSLDKSLVKAHMGLGLIYARMGKLGDAIRELELTVKADPTIEYAYFNLALVYMSAGSPEKAVAAMKRHLAMNPYDESAKRILTEIKSP